MRACGVCAHVMSTCTFYACACYVCAVRVCRVCRVCRVLFFCFLFSFFFGGVKMHVVSVRVVRVMCECVDWLSPFPSHFVCAV